MKRNSILRSAATTFALTLVAAIGLHAQPKLEIVGGDTHDWGKMAPGKLTATVKIRNAGTGELTISDVHPGCSCTAAPLDKKVLKPGEIGTMEVSVNAASANGPLEKIVTITSNDASSPSKVLHLKADIHRAITCLPMQYVIVNDGKLGVESAASTMTIKNTGDSPFTIETPQLAEGSNVAVRFDMKGSRELKPGEEFALKAYVTPKESTNIHGTIRVKTTSSETPWLEIPIGGTMSQAAATPQTPATPPQLTSTASHK